MAKMNVSVFQVADAIETMSPLEIKTMLRALSETKRDAIEFACQDMRTALPSGKKWNNRG